MRYIQIPIIFLFFSINAICQDLNDSIINISVTGELNYRLIYSQYGHGNVKRDSLLNIWNSAIGLDQIPNNHYVVFNQDGPGKYNLNDLISIDDSIKIIKDIPKDSLNFFYLDPILVSSSNKIFQEVHTSNNWQLISEITGEQCICTHHSNLIVKNDIGSAMFEHLNNVRVYFLHYDDYISLLVVSTRFCRNQIIIYEIR